MPQTPLPFASPGARLFLEPPGRGAAAVVTRSRTSRPPRPRARPAGMKTDVFPIESPAEQRFLSSSFKDYARSPLLRLRRPIAHSAADRTTTIAGFPQPVRDSGAECHTSGGEGARRAYRPVSFEALPRAGPLRPHETEARGSCGGAMRRPLALSMLIALAACGTTREQSCDPGYRVTTDSPSADPPSLVLPGGRPGPGHVDLVNCK